MLPIIRHSFMIMMARKSLTYATGCNESISKKKKLPDEDGKRVVNPCRWLEELKECQDVRFMTDHETTHLLRAEAAVVDKSNSRITNRIFNWNNSVLETVIQAS
jgi:hypothetical protein